MQLEILIRIIIAVINCLFGSTVHAQTIQEYEKEQKELFLAEESAYEEKKHLEASWLKLQKERQQLEERAETERSLRVKEAEAHRQQVKDFYKALSGQNFQANRRNNENKKLKEEISKLQTAREEDEATHQAERKRLQKKITQSGETTASLNNTIEKLKNEHEFEIFYKNRVIKTITRQAMVENERRQSEAETHKEEIEDLSQELANCMNKYLVLLQRVKDSQAKRVSIQVQTELIHTADASCGTDTVTTADVSCGTETITFADASCATDIATIAEVTCGAEDDNITQEAPTPISVENNAKSTTKCPLCRSSINEDAHTKEDASHRAPAQKAELTSESSSGDSQKAAEDTTSEATSDSTSDAGHSVSDSISTDEATQEDKDEEKDPTDDYDPMDMSDGEHRETVKLIHPADEIADEDVEPFERPSPPPTLYVDVPPGTELTPLRYLSELFHLFPYGRNRLVETLEPLYEFSDFAAEGDPDDVEHIEAVREYYTSHRQELEKPEHMLKKHMEWTGHLYNSFKREMKLQNKATATYRDMAELYEQFIEENHDLIPLYEDCLLWKEKLTQRRR
ncbi:putative kinesin K39 [Planoprotostelium fungivorum]|uniref:Putative kinesin K39 n=1 Tax=Planoprotostelium fungivorum TaxID=1890364 RepID=A0A2P6MR62_9EUKA|nr:putative kinesin K39 [Planoprotostelium fungivorum]